jgi:hypothetical protein
MYNATHKLILSSEEKKTFDALQMITDHILITLQHCHYQSEISLPRLFENAYVTKYTFFDPFFNALKERNSDIEMHYYPAEIKKAWRYICFF